MDIAGKREFYEAIGALEELPVERWEVEALIARLQRLEAAMSYVFGTLALEGFKPTNRHEAVEDNA